MFRIRILNVNRYLSQMSRSRVSDLIVGQWEKQQSTIQPQALRDKQEEDLSHHEEEHTGRNIKSLLGYTCAICVAPASPIELNARLSDRRFLLADLVVERAEPIRRAPSSPIRLFRRDKCVRLDKRNTQHENMHVGASMCVCECKSGFISVLLCDTCCCLVTHMLSSERRRW